MLLEVEVLVELPDEEHEECLLNLFNSFSIISTCITVQVITQIAVVKIINEIIFFRGIVKRAGCIVLDILYGFCI